MQRKNNMVKFNGNLPAFVFDFQDGEYICEIEGFSISDRDTDKLVVKISTIEDTVCSMAFKMYYDLSGESLCKNSPLGRLLKELGLIRKNKIKWEELSGQQVLAEIVTSKSGNVYVKKLSAVPDDLRIEFDDETEYLVDDIEFDEDLDDGELEFDEVEDDDETKQQRSRKK